MLKESRTPLSIALGGLWASIAGATITNAAGTAPGRGWALGLAVLFGFLAAAVSGRFGDLSGIVDVIFSVFGLLATAYVIREFLAGTPCALETTASLSRVGGIVMVFIAEALGLAASVIVGIITSLLGLRTRLLAVGIGIFALVDVAVLFQAPAGLPIAQSGIGGQIFVCFVAFVLAFLLLNLPAVTLAGCSLGLVLADLSHDAGLSCAGPSWIGLGTLVTCIVVYIAFYMLFRSRFRLH